MIPFESFYLDNGLHVIVHSDPATSVVCLNTLYKVGSRNESPDKTGFAHLFEHLMFGGSRHIPDFDRPLQAVGGENNAFTNTDVTNYYTTVPSNNVETAFWLESDRMLGLSFDPSALETERSVVVEEFKQHYLNQPYGDAWHLVCDAAYQEHPYRWPTIGRSLDHIRDATMEDVREFFEQYYHPANAILVIAGDITVPNARRLAQKWYGDIVPGPACDPAIQAEPPQTEQRKVTASGKVPADRIYKCYHMAGRADEDYIPTDLLSDLIGRGKSSRLYRTLVMEQSLFSNLQAYVTGSKDPGLLVINGQLNPRTSLDEANEAIDRALWSVRNDEIDAELSKVKNLAVSTVLFEEAELLNRAMNLAYATFIGGTERVNEEAERINRVTSSDIKNCLEKVIRPDNETLLYYQKEKA